MREGEIIVWEMTAGSDSQAEESSREFESRRIDNTTPEYTLRMH